VNQPNRCFPTKSVAICQMLDDQEHGRLVEQYFRAAGNWTDVEILGRSAAVAGADPLYAVVGRSFCSRPASGV